MIEVRYNEPMNRHTSFKIGGPVAELWLPQTKLDLTDAFAKLKRCGVTPLLFGNGSNLLFSDETKDIIAVKTVPSLGAVKLLGDTAVYAECGVTLARLALFAAENSLAGLEFAHGIPGSVGGAIYMNAGAYGGELGQAVRCVDILTAEGELTSLTREQCDFSYRHSVFHDNGAIVLSAVFDLSPSRETDIRAKMHELSVARREMQPLEYPSAGSAFKRPAAKNGEPQFAAAMIDECGLKGFRVGGAAVSNKHAGFVVNLGGATCDDVLRVLEHVQTVVFGRFGVTLEPEIKVVR